MSSTYSQAKSRSLWHHRLHLQGSIRSLTWRLWPVHSASFSALALYNCITSISWRNKCCTKIVLFRIPTSRSTEPDLDFDPVDEFVTFHSRRKLVQGSSILRTLQNYRQLGGQDLRFNEQIVRNPSSGFWLDPGLSFSFWGAFVVMLGVLIGREVWGSKKISC